MRILVANDLYGPSSAAGVAVNQARALRRMGHDVSFLGTVQKPDQVRTFVEESGLPVELVHVPPYDLRWRSWMSCLNRKALRAVKATLARLRPEVVIFHNVHIFLSYRALAAAKASGATVVLTVHDVMPFCFQKMFCFMSEKLDPKGPPISFKAPFPKCIPCARFRWSPLRNPWIRHHLKNHVDHLIAVSDEMRRALLDNGFEKSIALANGLDPSLPDESAAAREFRGKYGLTDKRVVLYGGRLDHRKGAEHLIRALAKAKERVPNAALLVVGSGLDGYETTMLELAKSLGVGDAVVTTGWLDQSGMGVAYSASDVICTPSLIFESFGLINAEGMLRGKPSVTSFFGGPKDVVEDGVSGFHVNPLNVDALADRLATLLGDDALRQRMGDAARQRILTKFHLETQTARLVEILSSPSGVAT